MKEKTERIKARKNLGQALNIATGLELNIYCSQGGFYPKLSKTSSAA